MANEAKLMFETSVAIPFRCDNATGIAKGCLLKIADGMVVQASTADGERFIGIAAEEKIANDGRNTIGVYVSGVFLVKDSGAGVTVGDVLKLNGANLVATQDEAGAQSLTETVGIALETAAATDTFYALIRGGFVTPSDSTDLTAAVDGSLMANVSFRSRPVVAEQTWTRNTSYVRKYFVESPLISDEDIKDCDIDILATNIRDLVRTVERQVDNRIINVITESYTPANINTAAATATWATVATCNPILDILGGKQEIRSFGYDPEGCILAMNSVEHKHLLNYLISVKGSSIPSFAAQKVESGVVMELLGCRVVVDENVATTFALMFVPQRACTWKSYTPLHSVVIDEPMIGKKIRVEEIGEGLLTDPKAVFLLTGTA